MKLHPADILVQEDQVTAPERDGRPPRFDAADQEAENRRPNSLEDKFPRKETSPSASQYACIRLRRPELDELISKLGTLAQARFTEARIPARIRGSVHLGFGVLWFYCHWTREAMSEIGLDAWARSV